MPFEDLKEKLLLGGIAPRHVRRYLRELEEHLADLTEAQRKAGLNDADAAMVARAQLGADEALAQAMIMQRDFRSVSARFPWVVFGLAPPVLLLLGFMLWAVAFLILSLAGGVLPRHQTGPLFLPGWYSLAGMIWKLASSFLTGPLLAWAMAVIARRQRLSLLWPVLGASLIVIMGHTTLFHADTRSIGIGITSPLPIWPRALGGAVPIHWPTFLVQSVLICLPLIWLISMRRRDLVKG